MPRSQYFIHNAIFVAMKYTGLLFLILFSFGAVWAQHKALADDTLQLTYRNIGHHQLVRNEPYFDVMTFRRYRPLSNDISPFSRSGNNGLPRHSYNYNTQDWNSANLLGGFQPLLFTKDSLRFYNASKPFTQLNYYNGSKSEQQFEIFHTQNLGEGMNLAFNYRRINSEGFYIRQLATHTQFNATVNFKSRDQRFHADLFYLINALENQENGGVIISDNESNTNNTILLDINLRNAQNQSRTQNWGAKSSYDFAYRDSTKEPLFSVSHEFNWLKGHRNYADNFTDAPDFFDVNIFDGAQSNDSSFAQTISNEVLASIYEDQFQVGARNEQLQWFQNYLINEETSSNFLVANANLDVIGIRFAADFEKGISGFHKDELDLKLNATFKDIKSFQPKLYGRLSRKQADYLLANQRANHHYYNFSFNTSNEVQVGAKVTQEKHQIMLDVNYRVLNNIVYLDSNQLAIQESDDISVIQVNVRKNFKFLKHFALNNNIQFQAISNTTVLPLPTLTTFHSLYYQNDFFKNSLNVMLGADLAYIGEYNGYAYSPSLAHFYLRNENSPMLGNIFQLDLFVNLRIHKAARIFVKMENITGKPFSEESFRIQDYPVPGRVLKLGLSWRMLN